MILDLSVIFLKVIALYILKLCYCFIKAVWLLEHVCEFCLLSLQNICVVWQYF